MIPLPSPINQTPSNLPQRIYGPRVVGMALAGVCVGTALWGEHINAVTWAALLMNSLLWPHIAFYLSDRAENPRYAEHRNLLLDSAFAGFWMASFQFHVLPAILVLAMPTMNAIAVGGARLVSRSVLTLSLGLCLGLTVWGLAFVPDSSLLAQIGSIPFLFFYPMLFATIMYRLVRKLDKQRDALRQLSERDALSGVYNRRFFEERIAQEFDNFRRHEKYVALVMVDIDDFKKINDQHGHTTGDEVIRKVGQVLQAHARRADVVSRFGGDEFAVLLPFTDAPEALEFVQRVQNAFAQIKVSDRRLAEAGMSFGIALPHAGMDHHQRWIESADAALYRVKSRQRGSVEVATLDTPPAPANERSGANR